MDSIIKLYLERAENELELAKIVFTITNDKKIRFQTSTNTLRMGKNPII